MLHHYFSQRIENYEPLNSDSENVSVELACSDDVQIPQSFRQVPKSLVVPVVAIWLSSFILALSLGFSLGKNDPTLFSKFFSGSMPLLAPAGSIKQTWHYNETFSGAPSEESEGAWDALFPEDSGFISHPNLPVNATSISVFHELHCLYSLRIAYYSATNQIPTPPNISSALAAKLAKHTEKQSQSHSHSHITHCFDYLRQVLMCMADTNLEDINWEFGGTTGYGFERTCRDFEGVVGFAGRWGFDMGLYVP